MTMEHARVAAALRDIVGTEHVLADVIPMAPYGVDALGIGAPPA